MSVLESADRSASAPAQAAISPADPFSRILRNIVALGSSQIITMASSAVVALMLPRFLGDVSLGKLALAGGYITYFGLLTGLGTGTYLSKKVAGNPSTVAHYAMNAALMRLPLSLLASILGVVTINLLGYDELTKRTVYLLLIGMTLSSIYGILFSSLQGLQEMRPVAVSQVAIKVVLAASVTALLLTGHGLLEVALVQSLSAGVGLAVVLYALARHVRFRFSVDLGLWRTLLLGGLPFFLTGVSNVIYARIDVLMLSGFTHDAVIGWYSAAYRIISIPGFAPSIIMMVIFPALSAAAAKGNLQSFNTLSRRALQAVLVGTVPMAMGLILLSDKLIGLLYPPEFARSVPIMIILGLQMPLVSADMIIGTALIARDKQRQWALAAVAAAFFNPAMNMFLIPLTQSAYGNGAIGAATATLLTELFLMMVGLRLLPPGVFDRSTLSTALRVVAAALLMAVPVWITRDMPIVVPIAVGVLVYSGSCLLLRAVVVSDLRRLWGYFLERQGGRASLPAGE